VKKFVTNQKIIKYIIDNNKINLCVVDFINDKMAYICKKENIINIEEYKKRHTHTVLHKAAFSKDGEILKLKKYMGDGEDDTNSGNFSITGFVYENNKHGFRGDEYEEVETISIETILEMVGDLGLLKIDIEGAEWDVLYNKDLSKINFITGEFHNWLGKEKQNKLFEWIEKTHQQIYSVGDGIGSHFIKMWKRK